MAFQIKTVPTWEFDTVGGSGGYDVNNYMPDGHACISSGGTSSYYLIISDDSDTDWFDYTSAIGVNGSSAYMTQGGLLDRTPTSDTIGGVTVTSYNYAGKSRLFSVSLKGTLPSRACMLTATFSSASGTQLFVRTGTFAYGQPSMSTADFAQSTSGWGLVGTIMDEIAFACIDSTDAVYVFSERTQKDMGNLYDSLAYGTFNTTSGFSSATITSLLPTGTTIYNVRYIGMANDRYHYFAVIYTDGTLKLGMYYWDDTTTGLTLCTAGSGVSNPLTISSSSFPTSASSYELTGLVPYEGVDDGSGDVYWCVLYDYYRIVRFAIDKTDWVTATVLDVPFDDTGGTWPTTWTASPTEPGWDGWLGNHKRVVLDHNPDDNTFWIFRYVIAYDYAGTQTGAEGWTVIKQSRAQLSRTTSSLSWTSWVEEPYQHIDQSYCAPMGYSSFDGIACMMEPAMINYWGRDHVDIHHLTQAQRYTGATSIWALNWWEIVPTYGDADMTPEATVYADGTLGGGGAPPLEHICTADLDGYADITAHGTVDAGLVVKVGKYRFKAGTGAETATTWLAGVNEPIEVIEYDFTEYSGKDAGVPYIEPHEKGTEISRYPFRLRFLVQNLSGSSINVRANLEMRYNGGAWEQWHRRVIEDPADGVTARPAEGFYLHSWAEIVPGTTVSVNEQFMTDYTRPYSLRTFFPSTDGYYGTDATNGDIWFYKTFGYSSAWTLEQSNKPWPPWHIGERTWGDDNFIFWSYLLDNTTYNGNSQYLYEKAGQVGADGEEPIYIDISVRDFVSVIDVDFSIRDNSDDTTSYYDPNNNVLDPSEPGVDDTIYDPAGVVHENDYHFFWVSYLSAGGPHYILEKQDGYAQRNLRLFDESTTDIYPWIEFLWKGSSYIFLLYSETSNDLDTRRLYFTRRKADRTEDWTYPPVIISPEFSQHYYGNIVFVRPNPDDSDEFFIFLLDHCDASVWYKIVYTISTNSFGSRIVLGEEPVLAEAMRNSYRMQEWNPVVDGDPYFISTRDPDVDDDLTSLTTNQIRDYWSPNPIKIHNSIDPGYYAIPSYPRLNLTEMNSRHPFAGGNDYIIEWPGLVFPRSGSNQFYFVHYTEGLIDPFSQINSYLECTRVPFSLSIGHGDDTTQQIGSGTFVTDNNGCSIAGPTPTCTIPNNNEAEFEFSLSLDFVKSMLDEYNYEGLIEFRLVDELNDNFPQDVLAKLYLNDHTSDRAKCDMEGLGIIFAEPLVESTTAPEGSSWMFGRAEFSADSAPLEVWGQCDMDGVACLEVWAHDSTVHAQADMYATSVVNAYDYKEEFYSDRYRWRFPNSSYQDNDNWAALANTVVTVGTDNPDLDPANDNMAPWFAGVVRIQLRTAILNRTLTAENTIDPQLEYRVNSGTWTKVGDTGAAILYGPSIDRRGTVYENATELDFSNPKPWPLPLVQNDINPSIIKPAVCPVDVRTFTQSQQDTWLSYIYESSNDASISQHYDHSDDDVSWTWGGIVELQEIDMLVAQYADVYMVRIPKVGAPFSTVVFTAVQDTVGNGSAHKIILTTTQTQAGGPNSQTTLVTRSTTGKILSFAVDGLRISSQDNRYLLFGVDEDMKMFQCQFDVNELTGAVTFVETVTEENIFDTGNTDYAPGPYGTVVFGESANWHIALIAYDGTSTHVWHKMRENTNGWSVSWQKAWTQDIATSTATVKDLALDMYVDGFGDPWIAVATNVTVGSDDSPIALLRGDFTHGNLPIDWTTYTPRVIDSFASSGAGTDAKYVRVILSYHSVYTTYRVKEGSNYVVKIAIAPYKVEGEILIMDLFTSTDSDSGGIGCCGDEPYVSFSYNNADSDILVYLVDTQDGNVTHNGGISTTYEQLCNMTVSGKQVNKYWTSLCVFNLAGGGSATEIESSLWINLDALTYGDFIEFRHNHTGITTYSYPSIFYGIKATYLGESDMTPEATISADGQAAFENDILGYADLEPEASISADAIVDHSATCNLQPFATLFADGFTFGARNAAMSVDLVLGVTMVGDVVEDAAIHKHQQFPYALESDYVERNLQAPYVVVNADLEDVLLDLINDARAAINLPPYKSYHRDLHPNHPAIQFGNLDIAQRHSQNMRDYHWYAHESSYYPIGWRTIPDRLAKLEPEGCTGLAENNNVYDDAQTLFDTWWDSPYHKANMLRDWSGVEHFYDAGGVPRAIYSDGSDVYVQVGLTSGTVNNYPEAGEIPLVCHNFLDYGRVDAVFLEMNKYQQFPYDLAVTIFELMEAPYLLDSYTRVSQQHSAPYTAVVDQQVESPYSPLVSAQHEAPMHYVVNAQLRYQYDDSTTISQQFIAKYALNRVIAHQQVDSPYSYEISSGLGAPYQSMVYVGSQNEAPYIARPIVGAQNEASYVVRPIVGAQNEAGYKVRPVVGQQLESDYSEMTYVSNQAEAPYSQNPVVGQQMQTYYESMALVGVQNVANYGELPIVSQQVSCPYDPFDVVSRGHTARYDNRAFAHAQNEGVYSLRLTPGSQVEAFYSGVDFVHNQVESPFDFLTYNIAENDNQAYYAMPPSGPQDATGVVTVTIDGMLVDADDVQIVQDEGNFWSADISLRDISIYAQVERDQTVVIDVYGDIYNFIVEQKSINRSSPVDVAGVIRAISPAAKHDSPRASGYSNTFDTDLQAKEIVEIILGESVTWELPLWNIPAFRLTADNAIPLDLAKTVVQAAGGILHHNKDGTITARPEFVVPVPNYWEGAYDFFYTDADDNLSQSAEYQYTDGYNKFRIKEAEADLQDKIEYEKYEEEAGGLIRCYPAPWRETVALVHTDGPVVRLDYIGVVYREEEETVEFTGGSSSLSNPVYDILAVEWLSDTLTGFAWVQDSEELTTDLTVNQGYGVAKITYRVRTIDYETDAPDGSTIQYVLEDIG